VDDRALRLRADHQEIAIPRRELVERRQELLALRPARGAPDALLGLARRQLEPFERLLRGLARASGMGGAPGALQGS
jgi:hypothetical protein